MTAPLGVTLVYPACHPRGGVERVVWETMRYFASQRPVTLVASAVDEPKPEGVAVRHITADQHPRALSPFRWRRRARRRLYGLSRQPTISYGAECPVGDILVVQSVHRAWLERGRSVRVGSIGVPAVTRHVLPRHRVLLALEKSYFGAAQHRWIAAVSENVATDLQRIYGIDRQRIVVVPNGFSRAQCSPERAAQLRAPDRERLGLRPEDVVLLLVANEWHRKGLRVLLDAVSMLNNERLHVLLVGRVRPDAYRSQIRRLRLESKVTYCGPMQDVAHAYAAADLLVLPTQYEAFGTVIVEALACGLPVITTSLAGASVAVTPGQNGLLQSDPDSADELVALLRIAIDESTRARWREAASASVRDYEWPAVLQAMTKVVDQVAASR